MADGQEQRDDAPVGDEVEWYRDPDGTEWFVEDGVRFELADDGFAYPVVGGTTDPAGAEVLEIVVEEDADGSGATDAADDRSLADSPAEVDAPEVDDTADVDEGHDQDDADGHSPFAPPTADAGAPAPPDVTTRIVRVRSDQEPAPSGDVTSPEPGDRGPDVTPDETRREQAHREHEGDTGTRPLLAVRGLDAGYGSLPVLKGVDLEVQPGETAVLLGLNGAGKTTTVANVCGALQPWGGQVMYDGEDVTGWSTSKAVASGVVMVPEGRRVFPDLSVARNLQVGAWGKRKQEGWFEEQRERVFDYFPRLREREKQLAGTLSGGEQQMLAVGRGLMAGPQLLIIDEASMGLAPVIVQDVFDIVAQINEDGVTVLLVEQNVGVLEVADIGYVMEQGRIVRVLEGEDLRDRAVVSEALMG